MLATLGARESAAWLTARGLDPGRTPRWHVEITLVAAPAIEVVHFQLNLYPEEWGYVFRADQRVSSIRVTDQAFVHGSDDHALLARTPPLVRVRALIQALARERMVTFPPAQADIRSNLPRATACAREWLRAG